jgi:hypothetical protein
MTDLKTQAQQALGYLLEMRKMEAQGFTLASVANDGGVGTGFVDELERILRALAEAVLRQHTDPEQALMLVAHIGERWTKLCPGQSWENWVARLRLAAARTED